LQSENEIYGWLIGYQKDNIPIILAIVECKRFEQQSLISAIPHAEEFQEISSIMPQGIGPIGIYHSHPFSSKIFHSHTDDSTLISLSKQFPNCTSIVTNGKEINYYKRGKNEKIQEISAEFSSPKMIKFFNISFNEVFHLRIDNNILKSKEDRKQLNIKLYNSLSTFLDKIWDELEYFEYRREVVKNALIKLYLTKNIEGKSIQIKIPEKFKENGEVRLQLSKEKEENNNFIQFKLKIKVKIPIYYTLLMKMKLLQALKT